MARVINITSFWNYRVANDHPSGALRAIKDYQQLVPTPSRIRKQYKPGYQLFPIGDPARGSRELVVAFQSPISASIESNVDYRIRCDALRILQAQLAITGDGLRILAEALRINAAAAGVGLDGSGIACD